MKGFLEALGRPKPSQPNLPRSAKCYVQPELRAAESLEVEARMP